MNQSSRLWKAAPWVSRAVLVPPAVIMTLIAARFITDPVHAAGVALGEAVAMTHMRVFGAFVMMNTVVVVFCLVSLQRLRYGLAHVAVLMALAILVRALGVAWDGTPVRQELRLFTPEAVFLALSSLGLLLETARIHRARIAE